MTTNEYLMNPSIPVVTRGTGIFRDYAACADGFELSIQASASEFHDTCYPRSNAGPWTLVELAMEPDERLAKYDAHAPKGFLKSRRSWHAYTSVPVELVDEIVAEHGGIVGRTIRD